MSLDKKIKELARRCPGTSFTIETQGDGTITIEIIEFGRPFVVSEERAGLTDGVWPENWFDFELSRRPVNDTSSSNDIYCVNCPTCGNVPLGYDNYCCQMMQPDRHWYCPRCGGAADFDDETYEKIREGGTCQSH